MPRRVVGPADQAEPEGEADHRPDRPKGESRQVAH